MRPGRAKHITLAAAALAAAVVIIGGLALRGTLQDLWLIRDLSSKDIAARDAAAQRLVDRRSRLAIPHLFRAYRGTAQFESRVALLLDAFGPEAAIPALEETLDAPEVRDRRVAVESLVRVSGDHPTAVPALCRALRDPDPELRSLVLRGGNRALPHRKTSGGTTAGSHRDPRGR